MLKRMLIFGLAITVVSLLSTVAFGETYTYNTTGDVAISLTIANIRILDMGASNDDISWVTVTAADLDNEFVVRRAGTSFVVDSNDANGWHVNAYVASDWSPSGELSYTDLYLNSGVVHAGGMAVTTLDSNTWDTFTQTGSTGALNVAYSADQGSDCVIAVDYKIALGWTIDPNTYTITITYTLETGTGV